MKQKVKDYLIENNLTDVNKVVAHIEELKASKGLPIEKKQMMFELIYYIYNDSSSLDSFFAGEALKRSAENRGYKIIGETKFYYPMGVLNKNKGMTFLDEAIELSAEKENKIRATFYKGKDNIIIDVMAFGTIEEAKEYFTKSDWEEVFYYMVGTNITLRESKKSAEKTEKQGVLNNHAKEILKGAGTKDHGEVKPNSTRHKAPVHCGGYNRLIFKDNPHLGENTSITPDQVREGIQKGVEILETLKKKKVDVLEMGQIVGKKETEGKLYYEISWEFIEEIAKRMAKNKGDKYDLYNWKRPITPKGIEDLKQAINRHHIEVMKGNYKDGEEVLGHIVSYACNSMMLWEQLNKS